MRGGGGRDERVGRGLEGFGLRRWALRVFRVRTLPACNYKHEQKPFQAELDKKLLDAGREVRGREVVGVRPKQVCQQISVRGLPACTHIQKSRDSFKLKWPLWPKKVACQRNVAWVCRDDMALGHVHGLVCYLENAVAREPLLS